MGKLKVGDKVEVYWVDANTCSHGVHSLEEAQAHNVAEAKTVGYLLKKDASCVVLAMTSFYDTKLPSTETAEVGYRHIWTVPTSAIKSIKKQKDESE